MNEVNISIIMYGSNIVGSNIVGSNIISRNIRDNRNNGSKKLKNDQI